jgi:hypothetical protein
MGRIVMAINRVYESRRVEGFARAAFARFKDKRVKAFNELPDKQCKYTHTYLFPDG